MLSRASRKPAAKAQRTARKAARGVKKAAANPWFERAARMGYLVRGILYGVMGVLAFRVALGAGSETADQRGSVYLLADSPVRPELLVAVVVGVGAYALWGFVRAVYDPLRRGSDPMGLVERLGFVWSGLSYLGLLVFTLQFLFGSSGAGKQDTIQQTVQGLLSHPAGAWVAGIAGATAVVAGLGQFVDAYKAGFRKDMKRRAMSGLERLVADSLGRFGMFARGVIFTMVGWFVVQAAIHNDSSRAKGIGPAFVELARQPLGHVLLGLVALGFMALGLHSFASARWVRMLNSG